MRKFTFILCIFMCTSILSFSQSAPKSKAISNALEFDGTDDFVDITSGTALFANLSEFTMCGYVYPTNQNAAWPDFDGFFGIKDELICDFYVAQINGTGVEARITTNTGTYTINPSDLSPVALDEWSHYALVYTGSELELYVNGELDGSVAASGEITYDNLNLHLGKLVFGTNDFYLDGKLDEVTLWSKALTEDEIQQYMCIEEDPSAISDLTAYYDFNEEDGFILPDYFENYDGNLTNMAGDEWISSEVCESGFKITFTITDELTGDPLEDANVDLDGLVKTTNEFGIAEFTNYDPGTFAYTVTKTDYYETSGEVTVVDEDISEDVSLDPVLYYTVTFNVTEDPGGMPIDSAIINFDGLLKYTDETGIAIFDGFLPGNYVYNVSKEGYSLTAGSIDIIDVDILEEVSLFSTEFDIAFNIIENPGSVPVDSAMIDLDGTIMYSDQTGTAVFENYMAGTYSYEISKNGYVLITGSAEVVDEDISIDITLVIDQLVENRHHTFKVYPNPTEGLLTIRSNENQKGMLRASILDLTGRKIMDITLDQQINKVDLKILQKGTYLLNIEHAEGRYTELILLQ